MFFLKNRLLSGLLAATVFSAFLVSAQPAQAATYDYDVDCSYAYGANVNTTISVTLQAGDVVTFTNVTTSGNGFCDNQFTNATLSSYFSSVPSSPYGQTRTFVVKSNPVAVTNSRIAIFTSNIGSGATNGRQFYFTIAAAPTSYTATFNANGGSGVMNAQTASASTALTANAFTRSGYSFAGWNTAANGSGTAYSNGATYSFGANVTLFAQWVVLPKTITFDSNGGSGSMSAQTASVATAITANTFTRSGFSFTGWNTAVNGSGSDFSDGATYNFSSDVTLYAQWSAIQGGMQQQVVQAPPVGPEIVSMGVVPIKAFTCEATVRISNLTPSPIFAIGGFTVTSSNDGNGEFKFQLPQGLSGFQTMTIRTLDGSYSFDGRLRVPNNCRVESRESVVVTGFAPGSAKLSERMKLQIREMLAARPQLASVSCTGFTSGPTRLTTDERLALRRATTVCDFLRELNRGVTIMNLTSAADLRLSSDARRVELVLGANPK